MVKHLHSNHRIVKIFEPKPSPLVVLYPDFYGRVSVLLSFVFLCSCSWTMLTVLLSKQPAPVYQRYLSPTTNFYNIPGKTKGCETFSLFLDQPHFYQFNINVYYLSYLKANTIQTSILLLLVVLGKLFVDKYFPSPK